MNENSTRSRILLIAQEMTGAEHAGETKMTDMSMDSIDRVDFIMRIETEFNVVIDDYAAMNFKTVNDIVNYLCA
jgi:acyl carrier protein